MKHLLPLLIALLPLLAHAESRLWQTHSGKSLEAELIDVKGSYAFLKAEEDGRTVRIMLSRLSKQDAEFAREWKQSQVKQIEMKPQSRAERPAPGERGPKYDRMRELEIKTAEIINDIREKNGLGRLKFDHEAADVARAHSADMIKQGYFSHDGKDGRSPFDRMRDGGVKFSGAAENIAINYSPAGAAEAWMNSEGHRKNILTGSFKRTGMGIAKKGDQLYLTQVFMN